MIARHWTGIVKKEKADDYVTHLRNETFKTLAGIIDFIDASILRRDVPDGVEFLIITKWRSFDAIKHFAGENYENAVVPVAAQEMMVRFDTLVKHYEVNYTMNISNTE